MGNMKLQSKLFVLAAAATVLISGCAKNGSAPSQAAKTDTAGGIPALSIADAKAIAEEAYIYGLPIVMNYAVMYEYSVNHDSPEF
jgi:hypothetical protein